jgi:hypothetical protein
MIFHVGLLVFGYSSTPPQYFARFTHFVNYRTKLFYNKI